MKALFLTIAIITLSLNSFAQRYNTNERLNDNKTAISKNVEMKPITLRTYYLEVSRLSGQKVSYKEFLKDTSLLKNIEGYELRVIEGKTQAFKDFGQVWVLAGEQTEIERLSEKLNS
jgi:hypothetical protein